MEASLASGARALCIASGGETAFDLLLGGAKDVVAIDINPSQALLVHLKGAVFRHLPSSEINTAFLHDARPAFKQLRSRLPREVTDYFDAHIGDLSGGLVRSGKIDRDLRRAVNLFQRFVHSKKQIEKLVRQPTIEEQARYYAANWNTPRLRLGFRIAFSQPVLNHIFGKQFGILVPKGFGSQVQSEVEKVLTSVPLEDNPYVWDIFFGEYPTEALPDWLTAFGHRRMAQVISRLGLEVGNVSDWLVRQPEPTLNLVCLSNILDGSGVLEKTNLIKALERAVVPGAYVVARSLFNSPIGLEECSSGKLKRVEITDWVDRSLFCRNVEVYRWTTN